jgi:hypothetical protein
MPLATNFRFPVNKHTDKEAMKRFVDVILDGCQGDENTVTRNATWIFEIVHEMGYSSIDLSNWNSGPVGYAEFT